MPLHRLLQLSISLCLAQLPAVCLADPIIIQGSTTFARHLLANQKQKLEADSGQEIALIPNKSLPGMIALLEGRAHIAMISAPLETELSVLKQLRPEAPVQHFRGHEIRRVPVAIIVNPANPVRSATLDQVRGILLGKITNWSELGGADVPIRAVLVGGGGGVTSVVLDQLLEGKQPLPSVTLYTKTPVQLVEIVKQEPGFVGFAQQELAKQRSAPELDTEQDIVQVLSLVTLGPPTQGMQNVIDAARRLPIAQ
jgi:phosphate transport system substrate-binding protein